MVIYFIALMLTILIIVLLDQFSARKLIGNLTKALIMSLPLSMVAGLRTPNIGRDLITYGISNFQVAHNFNSFSSYYNYITNTNETEYGYAVLNFIVSRFTNNLNLFLFVLSLFTLIPFFLGAINLNNKYKSPIVLQTVFYFSILYGASLNIMRQSVAITWLFLALSVLLKAKNLKWLKSLLLWIIAISFHRTAIIGILIFMLYYYFDAGNHKNVLTRKLYIIFSIGLFLTFSFLIIKGVISIPFFDKYNQYLDDENISLATATVTWIRPVIFSLFPSLAIMLLCLSGKRKNSNFISYDNNKLFSSDITFFNSMLLLSIIFIFGGLGNGLYPRIGQYFNIFTAFAIPLSIKIWFKPGERYFMYILFLICYLSIFAFLTHWGENQIYPYSWILYFDT